MPGGDGARSLDCPRAAQNRRIVRAPQKNSSVPASVAEDIDGLLSAVLAAIESNHNSSKATHLVIMSNGGFDGFHPLLVKRLASLLTAE